MTKKLNSSQKNHCSFFNDKMKKNYKFNYKVNPKKWHDTMEIVFNEKGATFTPTKSTKVHKKWHGKINFTFNEKNETLKPTKFTKFNIK
jgi:hypothetical protein